MIVLFFNTNSICFISLSPFRAPLEYLWGLSSSPIPSTPPLQSSTMPPTPTPTPPASSPFSQTRTKTFQMAPPLLALYKHRQCQVWGVGGGVEGVQLPVKPPSLQWGPGASPNLLHACHMGAVLPGETLTGRTELNRVHIHCNAVR